MRAHMRQQQRGPRVRDVLMNPREELEGPFPGAVGAVGKPIVEEELELHVAGVASSTANHLRLDNLPIALTVDLGRIAWLLT